MFTRFEQFERDDIPTKRKNKPIRNNNYDNIAVQLGIKRAVVTADKLSKQTRLSTEDGLAVNRKSNGKDVLSKKNIQRVLSMESKMLEANIQRANRPVLSTNNNNTNFNKQLQNLKQISKISKIEEWLKTVDYHSALESPPLKKSRIKSSSSHSSTTTKPKESNAKKKTHRQNGNHQILQQLKKESETCETKEVYLVESDSCSDQSSTREECETNNFGVMIEPNKILKRHQKEAGIKLPTNSCCTAISSHDVKDVTKHKEHNPTINNVQENPSLYVDIDAIKREDPIVKLTKIDYQPSPKKMRPASFVLKSPGIHASSQTAISSVNLRDLKTLNVTNDLFVIKYKYKIDLHHDMYLHRTSKNIYDSKNNELTTWFDHVLNHYQPKCDAIVNENSNCFITLNSRFTAVYHTKNLDQLEVLSIDDGGDGRKQYSWIHDDSNPIRIHVEINKDIYSHYIGKENSSKLPEMVITRIFP